MEHALNTEAARSRNLTLVVASVLTRVLVIAGLVITPWFGAALLSTTAAGPGPISYPPAR